MAEAVAALSLAANVLQLLDYGRKFVTVAYKIWESGQEGVEGFAGLQTLCKDLHFALQSLQTTALPSHPSSLAEGNVAIANLADECKNLTQRMLNTLRQVGLPGSGRKRDAIKAAFKLQWNKDEIKALDTQLGEFRSQLTLRLLISVRSYATESVENQSHILEHLNKSQLENKQLHQKVDQLLLTSDQGLGSSAVDYVLNRVGGQVPDNLEESLQAALFGVTASNVNSIDAIRSSEIVVKPSRRQKLEAAFLSTLQYDEMLDRESTVAEAHQATFQWIFKKEDAGHTKKWACFGTWLQSPDQLYWLTGKAGSGKSTLMKFITQPPPKSSTVSPSDPDHTTKEPEPRCMMYLRQWAGVKPLVVLTYYFWAAGSKIQTTRAGLYRTLLHQALSMHPQLLPIASPTRWEALCLFGHDRRPLMEDELREILRRTLSELTSTAAVCLFIDGLDEFDGKHDDLIQFLKHLVDNTPVKVCVASRPWEVFEDAFQNKPSLRLEDLTYQDIKDFVTSRFQSDANFFQLGRREPDFANRLVEEVVQKASGIFLWVRLVVSSLLDGMKFGDRVTDLRRRLDSLPPDLEALYDRILEDLDPFYFEHAAQYFQIMRSCAQPLPALLLSFADEPSIDLVLQLSSQEMSLEVAIRVDTMRRRVNSRCKGLIEVGRSTSNTGLEEVRRLPAYYLHKTVKDYIESPSAQKRVLGGMDIAFDPYLGLCGGAWAMFKVAGKYPQDLSLCLQYGSRVSTKRVSDMMRLLDDVDTSISGMPTTERKELFDECESHLPYLNITTTIPYSIFDHIGAWTESFHSLVVKFNVVEYIRRRIPDKCLVSTEKYEKVKRQGNKSQGKTESSQLNRVSWRGLKTVASKIVSPTRNRVIQWPLLFDAIPILPVCTTTSMIGILLDRGADPNYEIPGVYKGLNGIKTYTAWIYTLAIILGVFASNSWDPERKALWEDIARLMLARGAKLDRKTISSALKMLVTNNYSRLEFQGTDRKAMVGITQQALLQMRDRGADLTFPLVYDLVDV